MKKVNLIVEGLRTELKTKVRHEMKSNAAQYKKLMKDLLIQVS